MDSSVHEVNKGGSSRSGDHLPGGGEHPTLVVHPDHLHGVAVLVDHHHHVVPDGHTPRPGPGELELLESHQGVILQPEEEGVYLWR